MALALLATTALALAASPMAAKASPPLSANRKAALRDVQTSDGDLRIGPATPGFQLTADGDATSVAFTLGHNWQGRGDKTRPGAVHAVSFKVSTPLDKDTQEGNFLTAEGRKGTSLGFSYTGMILPHPPQVSQERQMAILALHEKEFQACLPTTSPIRCPSYDEMVAEVEKDLRDDAFLDGEIWQFGVSGEVGKPAFGYRDPTTLAKLSERHSVVSAAVNGGVRLKRDRAYVGAALEYKNGRAEDSHRILCRATSTAGITECFNSSYAAPKRDESFNAIGVARWRSSGDQTPYAVEIKAGYNTEDKIYGVVGSLYLVPDNDGGLRGGLRVGWQSDDDDPLTKDDNLTVGIFVGAPFQLF